MKISSRIRMVVLATAAVLTAALTPAQPHVTIGVECEDFQFCGDWTTTHQPTGYSGRSVLFNGPDGATLPAVTAVKIPRAGRYALWARAGDFPEYLPGTRLFRVSVDGKLSDTTFGASGKPKYSWEPGGWFDLAEGEILLAVHSVPKRPFARADAILLTTDPNFTPTRRLGEAAHPRSPIVEMPLPPKPIPFALLPSQTARTSRRLSWRTSGHGSGFSRRRGTGSARSGLVLKSGAAKHGSMPGPTDRPKRIP